MKKEKISEANKIIIQINHAKRCIEWAKSHKNGQPEYMSAIIDTNKKKIEELEKELKGKFKMNKETIENANEILKNIKRNENAIGALVTFGNSEKYLLHYDTPEEKFDVFLEEDEIKLIIERKKLKVAELERELKEL